MTTPPLPQSGGAWIREPDGTLRRADEAAKAPAPARPKPDSPKPDKEAGK